uniref:Uncharacterized protein n=1 Tax=Moniliophthora roreri TaxID=221103 RepID=A0A0W0FN34_MONRR
MTAAGLPCSEASKECNIHFLCTLNTAPPLEMLDGIADQIEDGQIHGIWSWDTEYNEPILTLPWKYFCQICRVRGKDASDMEAFNKPDGLRDKEAQSDDDNLDDLDSDKDSVSSNASANSDGGEQPSPQASKEKAKKRSPRKKLLESLEVMYEQVKRFVKPGEPQMPSYTTEKLQEHLQCAQRVGADSELKKFQTQHGIKDTYQMFFIDRLVNSYKGQRTLADKQTALKCAIEALPDCTMSPIWRIRGLNPHLDTPVEILHVVLLGFVKYLWCNVIKNQLKDNKDKKRVLVAWLCSLNVEGLGMDSSTLNGDTLVNYYGSLMGGDFQKIAQVAPFVLHGMPEIMDLKKYLVTLMSEIESFLVHAAKWNVITQNVKRC